MITISAMCMIVYPAISKVKIMSRHDQQDGRQEQPGFIVNEKQLQAQQKDSRDKKKRRQQGVMMPAIAVIK